MDVFHLFNMLFNISHAHKNWLSSQLQKKNVGGKCRNLNIMSCFIPLEWLTIYNPSVMIRKVINSHLFFVERETYLMICRLLLFSLGTYFHCGWVAILLSLFLSFSLSPSLSYTYLLSLSFPLFTLSLFLFSLSQRKKPTLPCFPFSPSQLAASQALLECNLRPA